MHCRGAGAFWATDTPALWATWSTWDCRCAAPTTPPRASPCSLEEGAAGRIAVLGGDHPKSRQSQRFLVAAKQKQMQEQQEHDQQEHDQQQQQEEEEEAQEEEDTITDRIRKRRRRA